MTDQPALLVIDDDPSFCAVLQRAFTRRGWQVSVAHTQDAALSTAQRDFPSHILLDLNLDGHSGLSLITPLRETVPDGRIVLLTGYASIPTAVEAIKLGAANYLTKPAEVEAILAAFGDARQADELPDDTEHNPMSLRRLQWEHIQRVLQEHDGNISAAARQLGLHRRTLQRQLRKRPVKQ